MIEDPGLKSDNLHVRTGWLPHHPATQLLLPPRDPRHDRPDWKVQDGGDLPVAMLLEIEEGQRRSKRFVQTSEEFQGIL